VSVNTYDVGDVAVVTAMFTVSGTLTDPTAVTLRVRKPDGTTAVVTNTRTSLGLFTANITIDASGVWYYRWLGTGSAAAAEEGTFRVRTQRVT